jgi:basic membrane protein A
MMQRAAVLVPLLALLVGGCELDKPAAAPAPTPASAPKPGELKVALITEGSITDGGWNTAAYDGLKLIEKELGAKVEHLQAKTPQEFEDGFRDFARRGATLLFGHGFEFQDPAKKVGAEFPQATFIIMSGVEPFPNGAPIIFKIEEAMYLSGVVAAHVSKTKKVAAMGGMSIPPVVRGFKGFELGAKRVSKEIEVKEPVYLGDWGDPAKGREQALALAAAGVDVIIHNADKGGLGMFEAAKEKGFLAFGSNKDQNSVKPDVILGSAVIDVAGSMLDVAKEVKAGTFKPTKRLIGIKDGRVALVLNEALAKERLSDAARKDLEAAKKDLVEGKLSIE